MAETQAGELGAAKQLVEQVLEPDDEDKLTVYDAPKLFSLSLDIVDSAAQGMANVLGYPSGWPTLDRYIGGLVPGNVVIIAGRPGQGKSAVATNLAVNVAKTGVKVLLFSLEMTAAELGMRMVCRQAKVGWQLLRSGTATADNHRGLVDAAEALSHLPLVVIDHGDVTTTFIRSILRQHQPQVVIIDYVQLMASPGKDSRQQEVAAISRSLKLLAKEQGVCMVALAQLNRNIEMRGGAGASPLLSDLRDSGTLEQDADIVIFAAPRTGNDLELIVAKNRNGQVSTNGEVMLKWTRGLVDIEDPLQAAPHLKVAGA
jgi:replicative DNA helicase